MTAAEYVATSAAPDAAGAAGRKGTREKAVTLNDIGQMAVGRAIRELRARRALSQERLGFATGLHRNYVGALERGEINPTIRTLRAVARGLYVKPSELLALAERREPEIVREIERKRRDEQRGA